jgi:hypothetical protein
MNITKIMNMGYNNEFNQMQNEEIVIYWINEFSLSVEMDGLAGYFSGNNRQRIPIIANSFQAIGSRNLSNYLMLIYDEISNVIEDDQKVCEIIYSESHCGKMIDNFSILFEDDFDDWREKIENYISNFSQKRNEQEPTN